VRTEGGAPALLAAVRADVHREDDDLRAGPRRRVHGHADGARDRARRRPARQSVFGDRPRSRPERAVPDASEGNLRDRIMFITRKHVPRRTFLRGAGVTLALPLLESMVPALRPLRLTAAAPPKRFVGIWHPHGAAPGYWSPLQEG